MSAASGKDETTFDLRQVRSGIGFNADQKRTLKALGLGKIGRVRTLPDNPQVRGMVNKIRHLVEVVESDDSGRQA